MTKRWLLAPAVLIVIGGAVLTPMGREEPAARFAPPRPRAVWTADPDHADEFRSLALRRAKVWAPTDPAAAHFETNPPDPTGALSDSIVRCQFISKAATGTTTKFDCALPDGEVVKVKYGRTGEIHAELAASRLLGALGFGADRMYLIPRVRCYGCPNFPFYATIALDFFHARDLVTRHLPDDRFTDFEWVAVERRFGGAEIEGGASEGWAWYELDQIDPSAGGSSRAEVDAFRLAAVLIAHWDNKAPNQRLICLAQPGASPQPCPSPFAYIQDLGASFGPNKINLANWSAAPIWSEASRCTISMVNHPYGGGTFPDAQIGEAGRQLAARQLGALSEAQLTTLFGAARFREFHGKGPSADVGAWARTFRDKVSQIAGAGPCPA